MHLVDVGRKQARKAWNNVRGSYSKLLISEFTLLKAHWYDKQQTDPLSVCFQKFRLRVGEVLSR